MCVARVIDAKITAYEAKFHGATKSPCGSDDKIGMLHLVDGASCSAILGRSEASKMFDLSVDHFVRVSGWFCEGDQPLPIR